MKKILLLLLVAYQFAYATVETRPTTLQKAARFVDQGKYDEAVKTLESALKVMDLKSQGPIYYLIGVAHYQNENYESALASFENALDTSQNPKLDNKIDAYIEKTLKAQAFNDSIKFKNTLSYFIGLGHDSNIINLNKDNFTDVDLGSYSALYGLSYSYRLIHKMNYSVIPEVSISDNYSMDTSFKATSTIQSSDALQWGFLIPWKFKVSMASANDSMDIHLGFKNIMLPSENSKRDSAIHSFYVVTKSDLHFSSYYTVSPQLSFSKDTSLLTYLDPLDDQSALKIEFVLGNKYLVEESHQLLANLIYETNKADGANASYNKYGIHTGAQFSFIDRVYFGPYLKYLETDYYDRATERHDRNTMFSFDLTKYFSGSQSLAFTLSRSSNSSSNDLNNYQDLAFSLVWSDQLQF